MTWCAILVILDQRPAATSGIRASPAFCCYGPSSLVIFTKRSAPWICNWLLSILLTGFGDVLNFIQQITTCGHWSVDWVTKLFIILWNILTLGRGTIFGVGRRNFGSRSIFGILIVRYCCCMHKTRVQLLADLKNRIPFSWSRQFLYLSCFIACKLKLNLKQFIWTRPPYYISLEIDIQLNFLQIFLLWTLIHGTIVSSRWPRNTPSYGLLLLLWYLDEPGIYIHNIIF